MASQPLFDFSSLSFERPQFDAAAIEAVNPHRGAMRLLDAVVWERPDHQQAVAYKDIRPDEFWVPGHIPGRPLFPGVLMIEAAAQLASFVILRRFAADGHQHPFMGFVGLDGVKFRGQVVPGDRLIVIGQLVEYRPRRCVCDTQGWLRGALVFEAHITGMLM
jgi:3-hydroxyacyl-[acyl-carrier-protein] dehydratase